MQEEYHLEQELSLLDPGRIRLFLDEYNDLILDHADGRLPVTALRAFPLTSAGQFIVLKGDDGTEIGVIRDIAGLDEESRATLESDLERTYFAPVILQVNKLEENFHIPKWDVETDSGHRVFEVRSRRRDIRIMSGGRILLRDADGNRYEIPDYRRLDPVSRAFVETLI
ncbi:MAG: DUF1854 domain-containing protein [Gemmatimonadota bacterium]|nr:DUF1854 domain-containing protein [Gemmatimonadota bacterium]